MDTQELQDPKKVSAILFKNLNSIVNNIKKTKLLMIAMKPKDAVKIDIVKINKSETHPKGKHVTGKWQTLNSCHPGL